MENEVVNLSAVVEWLEGPPTVLAQPVHPLVAEEEHQGRIHRRIFDVEHIADVAPGTALAQVFILLSQLPGPTLVSAPIDGLVLSQNKHVLVLLAAPDLL